MGEEAETPTAPDIPMEETAEQSIAAIRAGREDTDNDRVAAEYGISDDSDETTDEVTEDDTTEDVDAPDTDDSEAEDDDADDSDDHDEEYTTEAGKALTGAREAFEAGDLDKALKLAFGDKVSAETFKINPKQYSALRHKARSNEAKSKEREAGLDKREAEGTAKAEQAMANVKAQAQQAVRELTPANDLHTAINRYKTHGDPDSVVAQFEKTTGEDFNSFLQKYVHNQKAPPVSKAVSGEMAAMQAKMDELQKRLDAKPEVSEAEKQAAEAQKLTQFNEYLDDQLEGNAVTKLDGWQGKVLREMKKHIDPQLGKSTISPQRAAKRIVARAVKAAEALGHTTAKPAKPKAKKASNTRSAAAPTGTETDSGAYDEDAAMRSIMRERRLRRRKEGK